MVLAGAMEFVWSLYGASTLVVASDGGAVLFTTLSCEALQGITFSGALFVMVMDWILEQLSAALGPLGGLMPVCADDGRGVERA